MRLNTLFGGSLPKNTSPEGARTRHLAQIKNAQLQNKKVAEYQLFDGSTAGQKFEIKQRIVNGIVHIDIYIDGALEQTQPTEITEGVDYRIKANFEDQYFAFQDTVFFSLVVEDPIPFNDTVRWLGGSFKLKNVNQNSFTVTL